MMTMEQYGSSHYLYCTNETCSSVSNTGLGMGVAGDPMGFPPTFDTSYTGKSIAIGDDGFPVLTHYKHNPMDGMYLIFVKCHNATCSTKTSSNLTTLYNDPYDPTANHGKITINEKGFPLITSDLQTGEEVITSCSTKTCSSFTNTTKSTATSNIARTIILPSGLPFTVLNVGTTIKTLRCATNTCIGTSGTVTSGISLGSAKSQQNSSGVGFLNVSSQKISSPNAFLPFAINVDGFDRLTINPNGNVGIGVTPHATYRLAVGVGGSGTNYGYVNNTTGAWSNSSDARLKKNIETYSNSLEKINLLRPVKYDMIADTDDTQKYIGFIAQEVEKILPNVVTTDLNGMKGISYAEFTPVLAGAIKELDLKIDNLDISHTAKDTYEFVNLHAKDIIAETIITDTIVTEDMKITGTLDTKDLKAETATISTLYAENIISKEGSISNLMSEKISSLRDEIKDIIVNIGTTQTMPENPLAEQSASWSIDPLTDTVQITGDVHLTDSLIIGAQLSVLGNTQLANAFVTGTFTAGEIAIKDNFIETTNTALYIQPSGLGAVHILGDTMIIADNGQVIVNADLNVNGKLSADSATVSGTLFANLIQAEEIETKKISVATDSATLVIAESGFEELATSSAQVESNATAGTVTLPAGKTEIILKNTKLGTNSMVYLTPVGSTNNQVIYLKDKYIPSVIASESEAIPSGEATSSATPTPSFTIAIDQSLDKDIEVNWWIIN
jgi:cytoskeletal protein CcmA (bactofilin family)